MIVWSFLMNFWNKCVVIPKLCFTWIPIGFPNTITLTSLEFLTCLVKSPLSCLLLTVQIYLVLIVITGFCAVSLGEVSSMFHHPGPYLLENCLHAATGKYYLLPLLFPARVLDLQRRYLLTALTIKDISPSSIIKWMANCPCRWSLESPNGCLWRLLLVSNSHLRFQRNIA